VSVLFKYLVLSFDAPIRNVTRRWVSVFDGSRKDPVLVVLDERRLRIVFGYRYDPTTKAFALEGPRRMTQKKMSKKRRLHRLFCSCQ
jgi:hypothetical protein